MTSIYANRHSAATRPRTGCRLYFDTETVPTRRPEVIAMLQEPIDQKHRTQMTDAGFEFREPTAEDIAVMQFDPIDEWHGMWRAYRAELYAVIHSTCLTGTFGSLAVMSYAVDDDAPVNLWDMNWDAPGYESWLLHELHRQIKASFTGSIQIIGHHIQFDRNMVRQRAIVNNALVHQIFTQEVKPWETGTVFDTMTAWTGDIRTRVKQDHLCLALGIDGKGTDLDDGEYIDGSMVWDFIQRGEIAKVATYCGGDVIRARKLHKIITGMSPSPCYSAPFTPGQPRITAVGA